MEFPNDATVMKVSCRQRPLLSFSMVSLLLIILGTLLGNDGSRLVVAFTSVSPLPLPLRVLPTQRMTTFGTTSSLHMARKNKESGKSGKGFGKVEAPPPTRPMEDVAAAIDKSRTSLPTTVADDGILKSVQGGSRAPPQMEVDTNVPVEERTKAILREQYGLRTREEQNEMERRQQTLKEQRQKLNQWKKMADQGQDFDLMQILPAPVLIVIDRFLKAGTAICTLLFVVAGMFITVEAYSKTTGNALPEDLDNFIVQTIEPNFTPGLLVLLGFSVSLGAFAAAQLSSASSNYREDR